jgi:hypothetical protein
MAGVLDWLGIGKVATDAVKKTTSGVADIITTAKGDITPEAKAEIRKLRLENEVRVLQSLRDFVISYEGSADQVPRWILVLRSLIRPVITIVTFGWFFALLSIDIVALMRGGEMRALTQLPQGFWVVFGIIIGFWFGGKAGERIAEKMKGGSQ